MSSHFLTGPIGFAWGVRISAFICLGLLIVSNLLFRLHVVPSHLPAPTSMVRSDKSWPSRISGTFSVLKEPAYLLACTAGFVYCLGLYFPSFYMVIFAESQGIDAGLVKWTLSIVNLSGILGRTLPNWLADRVGVLPVFTACLAGAGA